MRANSPAMAHDHVLPSFAQGDQVGPGELGARSSWPDHLSIYSSTFVQSGHRLLSTDRIRASARPATRPAGVHVRRVESRRGQPAACDCRYMLPPATVYSKTALCSDFEAQVFRYNEERGLLARRPGLEGAAGKEPGRHARFIADG